MDLKIASIAIADEAILVSRNLKDFEKVPDLTVQDWTR
jgi:tRNA(fMet)-specific endonuclease VapC